jgi:hemerythrin-like domain-containing protein
MKRDESLIALSRDHHQALKAAVNLRRASEQDLAETRQSTAKFWIDHGERHFQIEEQILLPAFARHADPGDAAVVKVLVEHVRIREGMGRVEAGEMTLEGCHELGDLLQAHVRHEERVLFPMIEQALPEPELIELGQRITEAEAR